MQRIHLTLFLLAVLSVLSFVACGATSTLRHVGTPTGKGPVDLKVQNLSDTPVNSLHVVETERLQEAKRKGYRFDSPEMMQLWSEDLLDNTALKVGETADVPGVSAGRWDVRVVDPDGRDQHIAGVKLKAGGKYVLELHEGSWRYPQ